MELNGMYFGKEEIYDIIRNVGGSWNDSKERPIVCLLKIDDTDLYWAIPVGNWNHRDKDAKIRIKNFLNRPEDNISSCYYHLGNTTTKSIFFISDVIPITDKYIEREYLGRNKSIYIIKNKPLLKELTRKLRRIIYYEDKNPNYFRQHITDVKNYLLEELKPEPKEAAQENNDKQKDTD
jgi:hypothetical protein